MYLVHPCAVTRQVLRLEANMLLAATPGMGAHLATGLRAALKAGGCKHLWSLSVTLNDFDNTFLDARGAGEGGRDHHRAKEKTGAERDRETDRKTKKDGGDRLLGLKASPPPRRVPAHPMNALALAHAFHPHAAGGGVGTLSDGSGHAVNRGGHRVRGGGGGGRTNGAHGCGIVSLGLPYAKLHPRTVAEIVTHAVSSLTHLDLSHCYIGPGGAAALALALGGGNSDDTIEGGRGRAGRGSHSLCSLKLQHNAIGDSGARAFGCALQTNRCLTSLSLASNSIGSAGGRALALALEGEGIVLARLDVGDNPLGEKSARFLVDTAAACVAPSASPAAVAKASSAALDGGKRSIGSCAWGVQILGLDRVAGATVTTRGAARRTTTATTAGNRRGKGEESLCSLSAAREDDGAYVQAGQLGLITVDKEVYVRPEDCTGADGFVQVR